jgi:hypothetical protein
LLSFIRPAILQPRRGGGLVWTEGQSGWGKTFQSARPAGGWHCSVSSARPYFSRGEAEVWSGRKGGLAKLKFFSQPGRPADGIAQFHPPGHTSAEARRKSGLDGRADWLAQAKFFSQPGRPADGIAQFHPPDHTSAGAGGWAGEHLAWRMRRPG